MTHRYIAMHKLSPGFETKLEVQKWIQRQQVPEEYKAVAYTHCPYVDSEAEIEMIAQRRRLLRDEYQRGIDSEKDRIRNLLML